MNIPAFVWLVLIPLLATPLVYLSAHAVKLIGRSFAQITALTAFVVAWVPFALAVDQLNQAGEMFYTLGGITLRMDWLSVLLAAIALGLGMLVALFSGAYISADSGQDKYYAMLVALVGVMIGLGTATDLFNLWIWFEAMAICTYLLVAFYQYQVVSLEAGLKYLVQSAAGSALVLVGIGLTLLETGTLNLMEIAQLHEVSPILFAAGALFVIGFGVKSALVPLHTWLPDAHSQAPSGISAMLSGVVIEAGLIAMLRSLAPLAHMTDRWGEMLIGFGAINMLVGNLMAMRQKQVKRLLAYSSIAHVGYMLVGIGIAICFGQVAGSQGSLFHLFNHGMMKSLAFLSVGALLFCLHILPGDHRPLMVEDLSGAARRYPVVVLCFSLAVLGLGGIPPISGFMSKWQILVAGIETHNLAAGLIAIFVALNSVLSLAYYAPLINIAYRRKQSDAVRHGGRLPSSMAAVMVVLAVGILVIGIWPGVMDWLIIPAGKTLFIAFVH